MIHDTTFSDNSVASKGGAVIVASGEDHSNVEFRRCVFSNNTAGSGALLDDPQGEGGAIVVGKKCSVLLADCLAEKNWAGKKVQVQGVLSCMSPPPEMLGAEAVDDAGHV